MNTSQATNNIALELSSKHGTTMLERLNNAQIFAIDWNESEWAFTLTEACDYYHCAQLTPEQLLTLADEIRAMAFEKMPAKP